MSPVAKSYLIRFVLGAGVVNIVSVTLEFNTMSMTVPGSSQTLRRNQGNAVMDYETLKILRAKRIKI